MKEEESLPFDPSTFILVAAGAQDSSAITLVRALRRAGLRITFADNAALATRASEAAACVIILRPTTWNTPALTIASQTPSHCLLPVLAEPMELPAGTWSHEAFHLYSEPDRITQEMIQILRAYLSTHLPQHRYQGTVSDMVTVPSILASPKRRPLRGRFFLRLLLVLILLVGIFFIAHTSILQHLSSSIPKITANSIPTTATHLSYATSAPGPCANNGGEWNIPNRYKKDKNTEVSDKYTDFHCETNGGLLSRTGDYNSAFSEISFGGISSTISLTNHYLVTVDAQVVSGNTDTTFTIDTHIHNNSYGRYSFTVDELGRWTAFTRNIDGVSTLNHLATGFFSRNASGYAKMYTLTLETNGPVMTFSLDGTQVTTVTDTTFADNNTIAFGFIDTTAQQPISALFSHFKFEELPASSLAPAQMAATATVQAGADLKTPYQTQTPGYGCDHGAGQWAPLADSDSSGSLHCTSDGLQLVHPGTSGTITIENFYWLNGTFVDHYQIDVELAFSAAGSGCGGIGTHGQRTGDFILYTFSICPDGFWEIYLTGKNSQVLTRGNVQAQSSYKLMVVSNGSRQSLSINGVQVASTSNSQLQGTAYISLLSGTIRSNSTSTAIFRDFVFTPLS